MNTKILFLGDFFLNGSYNIELPIECVHYPFILNLEGPISNRGKPTPEKISLVMREGIFERIFNRLLPMAVSLSNNHIMDYGNDAFEDTLINLNKLGVKYFGAGVPEDNYNNPLIITVGDIKVALLGYCYAGYYDQIKHVKEGFRYGPAPLEIKRIQKDIKNLNNTVDRIVVSLHWGIEESNFPSKEQVFLARKVVDIGADCVISHHAHVVQPVEKYRNKIIAYNLGNFIFSDLIIPCFDNSGNLKGYYKKKQRWWNKSSIGIFIDFATLSFNIYPFYFDRCQVRVKSNFFHQYVNFNLENNLTKLDELISKNLKLKKLVNIILKNIEEPKLPSIKSILNFLQMLIKDQ